MASVTLERPDLALFSDPGATRVVIPRLRAANRTRRYDSAMVRFEGDEYETEFRGEGKARTYDMAARFLGTEHAEMAALVGLLDLAREAADARLQLRLNSFDVPSLQPFEVVKVSEWSEPFVDARGWDVTFVASTVAYTIAV